MVITPASKGEVDCIEGLVLHGSRIVNVMSPASYSAAYPCSLHSSYAGDMYREPPVSNLSRCLTRVGTSSKTSRGRNMFVVRRKER
jgi:hypothetical protein